MPAGKDIVLIGFMGCGKTTVGRRIARIGGYEYTDTDDMIICAQKKSINEIFEQDGEAFFRDLETAALRELLETADDLKIRVISTGGGLPVRSENQELMKKIGTVVYLQADTDTLLERLRRDTSRPLLHSTEDLRTRVEQLMGERERVYRGAADISVSTDGRTQYEVALDIIRMAKKTSFH